MIMIDIGAPLLYVMVGWRYMFRKMFNIVCAQSKASTNPRLRDKWSYGAIEVFFAFIFTFFLVAIWLPIALVWGLSRGVHKTGKYLIHSPVFASQNMVRLFAGPEERYIPFVTKKEKA
jgi:hypothetical protein